MTRKGAVTDATTSGLRWLEWSLADDGMIALCMALERAEHKPEPVALLGWL